MIRAARTALERGVSLQLDQSSSHRSRELLQQLSRSYVCRERMQIDASTLPDELFDTVTTVLVAVARGASVRIVADDELLSTQQAAEILDVSRQYLTRLLDDGVIPQIRTGTHRRVALADVLAFKGKRSKERKQGLQTLVDMSEEMGGYTKLEKKR